MIFCGPVPNDVWRLIGNPRSESAKYHRRYIGEGFDDARPDTLFLDMPISWRGTLQQYVGRLHRRHKDKLVVRVYDYVDSSVPVLNRMSEKRLKAYETVGYTVARLPGEPGAQADLRFADD